MTRTRWEYMTAPAEPDTLNELGGLGWEAVAATLADVLLKRPAPDFREQVTLDQRRRYFRLWGLDEPGEEEQ